MSKRLEPDTSQKKIYKWPIKMASKYMKNDSTLLVIREIKNQCDYIINWND